jgi:hypothetical protein
MFIIKDSESRHYKSQTTLKDQGRTKKEAEIAGSFEIRLILIILTDNILPYQ